MSESRSDRVHLDKPWLTVAWESAHECVYARFKAFASSAQFREGTTQILLALQAHRASRLVSDNRLLEGVSDADQRWLQDRWIPMAVGAGLERIAVVLPREGPGKLDSEEIIAHSVGKAIFTRTFDSLPDAYAWLARG